MRSIDSAVFSIMTNLIVGVLAETSEFQTCYRIDGAVLPNAVRCENPVDYLREGCTDYSWSDTACFQVCPWYVSATTVESASPPTLVISTGSDISTGLLTGEATRTGSIPPSQYTNASAGPTESGSSSTNANLSTALGAAGYL
ncbi:hypothetical protein F4813DRAFT_384154 [Daldinia decipiens]|uniref:uncharacterized protein n=1 Tax=Daldinia decipiens TaxID=326647 RepID=UPI0020C238B5|nr:uncharacterized protein F4813DRAFT_384154 [Daldinia decipiens]KAI1662569.1 hypothetical protein F4813DRAFT_384154 [Daldinia decipiens]